MSHSSRTPSPTHSASSFPDLPPFPSTVPTAPLLRISLSKLLSRDPEEEARCWKACCNLGFFYLDLRASPSGLPHTISGESLLRNADELFTAMKSFFALPAEEKQKYDFASQGSYFGYKGYGAGIIDKSGRRDRNEFYNISKDAVLAQDDPNTRLPAPPVLTPHNPLFTSFIHTSHTLCTLLLSLLSTRLPLLPSTAQKGGLPSLHNLSAPSGDQIRFVKAPPQDPSTAGVALGEHTDFGSITLLFNRLGGLQVRLPAGIAPVAPEREPCSAAERELCRDGWAYVRPLEGHCVVNLGDALSRFSGGALRSNVHRVVGAPGEQGRVDRYSLVYFCRPGDGVALRRLVEGGAGAGAEEDGEEVTAKEWILRRALGRRKADGWEGSGGTEEVSMRGWA